MDNNLYAIHSVLQKMKDSNRNRFFSLSNLIIDFQQKNNEVLLNVNENQIEQLSNYETIEKEEYSELSHIYSSFALFNEIKKLTTRTTQIKKLNTIIDEALTNQESKDELKKMLNVCVLCNLLSRRLNKKTIQELNDYKLIAKLSQIHPNLCEWLDMQKIINFNTDEELINFVKNQYVTYDAINFEGLYSIYEEEFYNKIYDLIYLFQ